MSTSSDSNYQIIESKSGHKIPRINNIHLHSTYDPRYEAERFILENEETLKNNNKVLLFGLGFAYHAQYLVTFLKNLHQENYQILIIEPNLKIVSDCESLGLLPLGNILIFSGMEPNELFQNEEFLEFLIQKPVILPHPASFNLNSDYFKRLLSFRAEKDLKMMIPQIKSLELQRYLEQFPPEATLDSVIKEKISTKETLNDPFDYFFLALNNIKEGEQDKDAKNTNH